MEGFQFPIGNLRGKNSKSPTQFLGFFFIYFYPPCFRTIPHLEVTEEIVDVAVGAVAEEEIAMTAWTAMTMGAEVVPEADFIVEAVGSVELVVAVAGTLDEMTTEWVIVAVEEVEAVEGSIRSMMTLDVEMIVSTAAAETDWSGAMTESRKMAAVNLTVEDVEMIARTEGKTDSRMAEEMIEERIGGIIDLTAEERIEMAAWAVLAAGMQSVME